MTGFLRHFMVSESNDYSTCALLLCVYCKHVNYFTAKASKDTIKGANIQ